MDDLTATILKAMEQAAISGLCDEGQLEIAVQEARKLRPDLRSDDLLELVKDLQGHSGDADAASSAEPRLCGDAPSPTV